MPASPSPSPDDTQAHDHRNPPPRSIPRSEVPGCAAPETGPRRAGASPSPSRSVRSRPWSRPAAAWRPRPTQRRRQSRRPVGYQPARASRRRQPRRRRRPRPRHQPAASSRRRRSPAAFESPAYGYMIDLPDGSEVTAVVPATAPWDGATVIGSTARLVDQFHRNGQRRPSSSPRPPTSASTPTRRLSTRGRPRPRPLRGAHRHARLRDRRHACQSRVIRLPGPPRPRGDDWPRWHRPHREADHAAAREPRPREAVPRRLHVVPRAPQFWPADDASWPAGRRRAARGSPGSVSPRSGPPPGRRPRWTRARRARRRRRPETGRAPPARGSRSGSEPRVRDRRPCRRRTSSAG